MTSTAIQPPGSDGGNQRLGCGYNGFHRRDGGFGRHLCRRNRRFGRSTGAWAAALAALAVACAVFWAVFAACCVVLILALAVFSAVLMDLLAVFTRPFDGRGRLLDGFAAPVYGFNAFLSPIQGLNGSALLPERPYRPRDPVRRLVPARGWSASPPASPLVFSAVRLRLCASGYSL